MAEINQDDIMNTLAYLRGERSAPTTNIAGRLDFIQRTLDEIYEYHPWRFSHVANVSIAVDASGIASLPSGLTFQHGVQVRYMSGTDEIPLDEINVADRQKSVDGDQVYWIDSRGDDKYNVVTKESIDHIVVDYHHVAPTINASIGTPFPDRLTVALGANRWQKMSEDPQADISQDDVIFSNRLANNIAAENLNRPKIARRTIHTESNKYTGDF